MVQRLASDRNPPFFESWIVIHLYKDIDIYICPYHILFVYPAIDSTL